MTRGAAAEPRCAKPSYGTRMKTLCFIIAWCLLFILCWPLALLAILLWPLALLLSIPFRLLSLTFEASFALLRAIMLLPARLLGHGTGAAGRTR